MFRKLALAVALSSTAGITLADEFTFVALDTATQSVLSVAPLLNPAR